MSIETNLNVAPYFDDFSEDKNYYKILFRPNVSVQARELTQIQDILQNQVERLGNHVFKSGTIVSGVNFQFYPSYSYVKILDNQNDGMPAIPTEYVNYYAKNTANVQAKIINAKQGLQATDPDTNYLYLNYLNSGNDNQTPEFSNNDVLTIFSKNYEIFDFNIINGGTLFANSDSVQIVSALLVSSSSIDPNAGISQTIGTNVANAYVFEANNNFSITINNVTYNSADGYTILKIRPFTNDLSNSSVTSSKWSISENNFIVQGANSAYVEALIGTGAAAILTTDSSGVINNLSLTNPGTGYVVDPYVTVRSSTGTYTNFELTPQMYKAQVTVADATYNRNNSKPVGNAYAFGVTEGIIYQKGFFLKVDSQTTIVNNYSTNVDSVAVGFISTESIVNTNIDTTLLDNATGTPNFAAPGANRLKFTPTLNVVNTASSAANNSFFPLVEFRNGQPYKQYKNTLYNILSKEFERRTTETSGNFVVDPFIVSTKDQGTWSNTYFDAVSDPGILYIDGVRVDTQRNTYVPVRRSNDSLILPSQIASLNYGNYVLVKELAGFIDTKSAPDVVLYDTAYGYYSNNKKNIAPTGVKIGTAKVRSIVFDSGTPGTNTALYRVYLFDINIIQGYQFIQAKSIFYDGVSYDGIADLVLETNALGKQVAVIKDVKNSTLLFDIGVQGVKSVNGVTYGYRSAAASANISSNGVASFTITDSFIYGNNATLSATQKREIILTPLANAVSTNTANCTVVRNRDFVTGSLLDSYYRAGDRIYMENSSDSSINLYTSIKSISNSAYMTINDVWPFDSNTSINVSRYLPANIPLSLDDTRVSVNTNSTGTTLYVNLNGLSTNTFTMSSSVPASIMYNAVKTNFQKLSKLVSRNNYVKICLANNAATTRGPWCLGIPDAFRLNKVFVANTSSVNTNSTDITDNFYIDNGQTSDYYGHSQLVMRNTLSRTLSTDQWLLVEFDSFYLGTPSAAGYFSIQSYPIDYTNSSRSTMGNTYINIVEVPEFRLSNGTIINLENTIDFRPRIVATATLTSTPASATVNPVNTRSFYSTDKIFPIPDSNVLFNYEYYLRRKDRVVINKSGAINVIEGTPSLKPVTTEASPDQITIATLEIPAYPSLPKVPDSNVVDLFTKRMGSSGTLFNKQSFYTVKDVYTATDSDKAPRRYSMGDISKLESRIKNLEYYTSLNLLEKKTTDLNIPSSLNPALNRTKYGVFVDNFSDYTNADLNNKEMTAYIDQERGYLMPQIKSFNTQARFNYNDSTTLNSLRYYGNTVGESGPGKWNEHVLMLPANGEVEILAQSRFTSAINGTGGDTKFVGDMVAEPSNLKVAFKVAIKQTDTTLLENAPNIDVTPDLLLKNTDPRAVLSSSKYYVNEGNTVDISLITVNIPDNTTYAYTITGNNITANNLSVPLTGTMTVRGDNTFALANLSINIVNNNIIASDKTMVFTVNTTPTASINVILTTVSSNTSYTLTFAAPSGSDAIAEGETGVFTFSTVYPRVNTYPFTISGIGITNTDLTIVAASNSTCNVSVDSTGLGGTLTVNSSGQSTMVLNVADDSLIEGIEIAELKIGYPANKTYQFTVRDTTKAKFPLKVDNSLISPGCTAIFSLTSTGTVANGANASYVITGVDPLDINVPLTGNVTFANNYANLSITANASSLSNGLKTLLYSVTPPSGNNYDTTVQTVSTTIKFNRDDSVSLTCNAATLPETNTARFTVACSNGYTGNLAYVITGTTGFTSGDINKALSGNIAITSGTGTFDVTALNNASGESDETFTLTLTGVTEGTTGRALSRSVTIPADTPVSNPAFRLSASKTTVVEGNSVVFTLIGNYVGNGSLTYTITPSTTNGSGLTQSDFTTSMTGTLTYADDGTGTNTSIGSVTVNIANDLINEPDETFAFTLSGTATNIDGNPAFVTIKNTDAPTPTLTVDKRVVYTTGSVTPGSTVTYTLTVPGAADGTTYPYTILNVLGTSVPARYNSESASIYPGSVITSVANQDKPNVVSADVRGVFTISGGTATKTVRYFADSNDVSGALDEVKLLRVRLGTDPGDLVRGSNDLYAPGVTTSRVISTSTSTITSNFDKTSITAGSTFNYKLSVTQGIDSILFNYKIDGVTSDDLCGAALSGQLVTKRANTADVKSNVDTYANLSFTSNSSLSTNKTMILTATPLNNQALSPTIISADTLLIGANKPTTPVYDLKINTYVGSFSAPFYLGSTSYIISTSVKNYAFLYCFFNTANITKGANLTVKLFNETSNAYLLSTLQKTLGTSGSDDFLIALSPDEPVVSGITQSTITTSGIWNLPVNVTTTNFLQPAPTTLSIFSNYNAPSYTTNYKAGDIARVEIYSGSTKIAEARGVFPDPKLTTTQPAGVIYQKIGYA